MPRSDTHTWSLADELDELDREIVVKEREYRTWERAPFEGRVTGPDHERRGHFLLQEIRDLREKRAALEAERDREDQVA